jgi:hypothetical protein
MMDAVEIARDTIAALCAMAADAAMIVAQLCALARVGRLWIVGEPMP